MKVTYQDHMGTDLDVVNAARVSFKKESQWLFDTEMDTFLEGVLDKQDAGLINYLAKHEHWSPFTHQVVRFHFKCPLFIARQLWKSKVGLSISEPEGWNEVSRRYVDEEPEFYVPDVWRKRAENIKQGSTDIDVSAGRDFYMDQAILKDVSLEEAIEINNEETLRMYKDMLDFGVAPEQARMILPQSMYTEWVWTGTLAAWARICKQRLDSHAQKEVQEVAQQVAKEMERLFPVSWKALMEV